MQDFSFFMVQLLDNFLSLIIYEDWKSWGSSFDERRHSTCKPEVSASTFRGVEMASSQSTQGLTFSALGSQHITSLGRD